MTVAATSSPRAERDLRSAGSRSNNFSPSLRTRKLSDVQSRKEKALFQRDHSYTKRKPLITTYPWHQLKTKSYLDDAERHYGRKETWAVAYKDNPERLADLTMLMTDYINDLLAQSKMAHNRAVRLRSRCIKQQMQFQSYVIAGASNPAVLRAWAAEEALKHPNDANDTAEEPSTTRPPLNAVSSGELVDEPVASKEEEERRELHRRERYERGLNAQLTSSSAALDGMTQRDQRFAGYSAYPFLRQRAVSPADSHTLDPSLVDWSAKYFPDDDHATFVPPRALQQAAATARGTGAPEQMQLSDSETVARSEGAGRQGSNSTKSPKQRRHPTAGTTRARLGATLKTHLETRRPTFDGEGTFYHVRQNGLDGDVASGRAAKPTKQMKSSEALGKGQAVVRVDWDTVTKAHSTRKTPEVHRARERLIRLTRGEDPTSF